MKTTRPSTTVAKTSAAQCDFWTQADEPFQFLAACHEYANAADAIEKGDLLFWLAYSFR